LRERDGTTTERIASRSIVNLLTRRGMLDAATKL
jgi:hypothetical protein